MVIQFEGCVTKVTSGKEFRDGRPRVMIAVKGAEVFNRQLEIPQPGELTIDDEVRVLVEYRDPNDPVVQYDSQTPIPSTTAFADPGEA